MTAPLSELEKDPTRTHQACIEENMSALLHAGNISSWTYCPKTKKLSLSDYFIASLGYTTKNRDFSLKDACTLIHPDDVKKVKKSISDYITGKTANHYVELRVKNIKNNWIWFYAKASICEKNEQDKPLNIIGIFVNIDKIKRTRIQLEESHQKLDKTTALARIGYFEIDLIEKSFSNFETINRMFDITVESVLACEEFFTRFVDPAYYDITQERFLDFCRNPGEYMLEFPLSIQPGPVWVKVLIVDDPHIPHKAFGIMQDITTRKNNEKALQEEKYHAQESDRLKSAFLANLSHEIRTPLNSIVGFSQLLTDGDYDKDQCEDFARQISLATNSLLRLIEDILDMSKIESGNYQFYYDSLDLPLFFGELERIKQKDLPATLSLEFDRRSPRLSFNTDRLRLRQVVLSLLDNAVKFTPRGHVLFGYTLIDEGRSLRIFVKDTGLGIPEDKQKQIFERFVKLYPNKVGAGLGLSISRAIVESLGGSISLVSKMGKGSEFSVILPAKEDLISQISYN